MYLPKYCPKCGFPIRPHAWYEDGYLVEYTFRCPDCDYAEDWSYGTYFEPDDTEDYEDDEEVEDNGDEEDD